MMIMVLVDVKIEGLQDYGTSFIVHTLMITMKGAEGEYQRAVKSAIQDLCCSMKKTALPFYFSSAWSVDHRWIDVHDKTKDSRYTECELRIKVTGGCKTAKEREQVQETWVVVHFTYLESITRD